ncbi:hypothetical protein IJT93_08985 [bacterium]|nr:hypothetical protein [bacterium]
MTIKVGHFPITVRYIYIKRGEVSKVKACYRRVSRIFEDEAVKYRFVLYLITEGLSRPNFDCGDLHLPLRIDYQRKDGPDLPKKKFTEAELALFGEILSVYDYLDEVTTDSVDGFYFFKYARFKYYSLFSESLPSRITSFFKSVFELFRS